MKKYDDITKFIAGYAALVNTSNEIPQIDMANIDKYIDKLSAIDRSDRPVKTWSFGLMAALQAIKHADKRTPEDLAQSLYYALKIMALGHEPKEVNTNEIN